MNDQCDGERSFMDVGLDFARDDFDGEEKAAILAWYRDVHDYRGLDLAPFARFWIEHDPGGFKRLKRHLLTLEEGEGADVLPLVCGVLMYAHTYTAVGNAKGALYEIIAVRALGITRAQVVEVVRHASLFGGPVGLNPLSEIAEQYFEEWGDEDSSSAVSWPDGWAPDIDVFRTGIDHSTNVLTADELNMVRRWHMRVYGEVPAFVEHLVNLHPSAYKTLRVREERLLSGELPAQLFPLLTLHLAIVQGRPSMMRRAAQIAAALGVRRHHLVCTLYWGSVAGGSLVLEEAFDAVHDVLDELD